MSLLKKWIRKALPNPLDVMLVKACKEKKHRILLGWNRGLGDIPLGLYAIKQRIISFIPSADITFLTRPDLVEGFEMLGGCKVIACPQWVRGRGYDIYASLLDGGYNPSSWDLIIPAPDPSYWCSWQLGKLQPQLLWQDSWDSLCCEFGLDLEEKYLAVHMQTMTSYGYEKNWPLEHFSLLFHQIREKKNTKIILFGAVEHTFKEVEGAIDLRGKTTLKQMLSIIKGCCSHLLAPDSGVLSTVYYLSACFPLRVVSLWADPGQGILKQAVPPPNPRLFHIPLIAKNKDLRGVAVQKVYDALFNEGGGCEL